MVPAYATVSAGDGARAGAEASGPPRTGSPPRAHRAAPAPAGRAAPCRAAPRRPGPHATAAPGLATAPRLARKPRQRPRPPAAARPSPRTSRSPSASAPERSTGGGDARVSMLVWVMMGIAVWHFMVFLPDRFWGGIVGAFGAAIIGAAIFGFIVAGGTVPGRHETDLAPGLHRHPRRADRPGGLLRVGHPLRQRADLVGADLFRRRHLDRPLLGRADPERVAERVAQAAVGAVEALGRLLRELDSLGLQVLVGPVDVVDGDDRPPFPSRPWSRARGPARRSHRREPAARASPAAARRSGWSGKLTVSQRMKPRSASVLTSKPSLPT